MTQLKIVEHPLIQHKLTYLRDKNTNNIDFRLLTKELTGFLLYEVMADFKLKTVQIETPIQTTTAKILEREITLILILRAGLGMLDGCLELVPNARVGHIGLYRNETTLEPVEYYLKLPKNIQENNVILFDPMLATGGTAVRAISCIKKAGVRNIKFVCIIAAPAGVVALHAAHPDVPIFTAALDERLNENGYIVPGLGDAGDRLFGTE
jgi:uracil phosphoribosyltransferase